MHLHNSMWYVLCSCYGYSSIASIKWTNFFFVFFLYFRISTSAANHWSMIIIVRYWNDFMMIGYAHRLPLIRNAKSHLIMYILKTSSYFFKNIRHSSFTYIFFAFRIPFFFLCGFRKSILIQVCCWWFCTSSFHNS